MRVGELPLRDKRTKALIGVITVDRHDDGQNVIISFELGEPDVEVTIGNDIALALADLLMDATAPNQSTGE